MAVVRREALKTLVGAVIAAAVYARPLSASTEGTARVTKQLPSFELQGEPASLASLALDIDGYSIVRGGSETFAVWLKSKDGQARFVRVAQRDALPMFEVFTLDIATADELTERWKKWKPPVLPDDVPEPLRTMMTARPAAPVPPKTFDAWPFGEWRTQVLRRAEFIVEDVPVEGAVGSRPNMQSAARPMNVPREASASCEVAAGLLFTGSKGRRLLMGVGWMPENMVVTEEAAKIDEYLKPCEMVELSTYLERISKPV